MRSGSSDGLLLSPSGLAPATAAFKEVTLLSSMALIGSFWPGSEVKASGLLSLHKQEGKAGRSPVARCESLLWSPGGSSAAAVGSAGGGVVRSVCMSGLVPSEPRLRSGKLSATDCLRGSWSPSSPVLLNALWPVLRLVVPMLRVVEPRSDDVPLRGDMTPRPIREDAAEASDSSTRRPGCSLPGEDSEVGPSSGVEDNTARCLLPLAPFLGKDSGSVKHQTSATTSGAASGVLVVGPQELVVVGWCNYSRKGLADSPPSIWTYPRVWRRPTSRGFWSQTQHPRQPEVGRLHTPFNSHACASSPPECR